VNNPSSLPSHLITTHVIFTYDSPSPRYKNLHSFPFNHSPSDRPCNYNKNEDTLLDKESTLV